MRQVTHTMVGGLVLAGLVATAAAAETGNGAAVARVPTCTVSGCHPEIGQHKRVHDPVAQNQCDACHEPKAGATALAAGARHEFKRAGDDPELCYECHDRLGGDSVVHGPVKMGVCVLCHDPHGSEHAALLRVESDRQLCLQCHRLPFDQGDHVHAPADDGTCMACHHPHGSDHAKVLVAAPPELCLDCHDTIEELLDEADVAHDPVTEGRACLECHEPHASKAKPLLVREPMALCLSCHDKELDSGDGKVRNITEHLKTHPNHHGPVSDGECSACHTVHGGAVFSLLTGAYPAKASAPYDEDAYALCFDCHDSEMVEEERDEEVTEFRNGDLNLHYVHVNRETDGCTCRACHDPHAGKGARLIADRVPAGKGAGALTYQATDTGGSCATRCHANWSYDRDNPVQYP